MEISSVITAIISALVAAGVAITSYKVINRNKSKNTINQKGNNNNAFMNSNINIDSTVNKKDEEERNV